MKNARKTTKPAQRLKREKTRARWYELEDRFAPSEIRELPTQDDKAFVLGTIEGIVVIEFGKNWELERLRELVKWTRAQGFEAVFVPEGTRFLKLRKLDRDEESRLNADLEAAEARAREARELTEAIDYAREDAPTDSDA